MNEEQLIWVRKISGALALDPLPERPTDQQLAAHLVAIRAKEEEDEQKQKEVYLARFYQKAAAEKKEEAPKASPTPAPDQAKNTRQVRVVAVADADALSNQLYMINKDFALNSFNWLAANDTAISIRPKDELAQPLNMSGQEQTKMAFLIVLLLPVLVVVIGLFNVMRRQ